MFLKAVMAKRDMKTHTQNNSEKKFDESQSVN